MTGTDILQFWNLYHIDGIIYFISTILSAILCVLTIIAYKKSKVSRLKYAILAFGFFSVYTFYEFLEDYMTFIDLISDILPSILILAALILFFSSTLNSNKRRNL